MPSFVLWPSRGSRTDVWEHTFLWIYHVCVRCKRKSFFLHCTIYLSIPPSNFFNVYIYNIISWKHDLLVRALETSGSCPFAWSLADLRITGLDDPEGFYSHTNTYIQWIMYDLRLHICQSTTNQSENIPWRESLRTQWGIDQGAHDSSIRSFGSQGLRQWRKDWLRGANECRMMWLHVITVFLHIHTDSYNIRETA